MTDKEIKKVTEIRNLPESIWLNFGDECPDDTDFNNCSEVTWSKDKVFDKDVQYFRKPQCVSVEDGTTGDLNRVVDEYVDDLMRNNDKIAESDLSSASLGDVLRGMVCRILFKSPWVSVKDRLPKDDTVVLVHIADYDVLPALSHGMAYYKNGAWCFQDDYYYDCKVSHWMPIPPLKPSEP